MARAYDFGALPAYFQVGGLQLVDAADWYRFTMTGLGEDGNRITLSPSGIYPSHLHLDLFDASGALLAGSVNVTEFFDAFLPRYPRDEIQITGITVQEPFGESRLATGKRVLSLYGPLAFAQLLTRFAYRKLQGRSIAHLERCRIDICIELRER